MRFYYSLGHRTGVSTGIVGGFFYGIAWILAVFTVASVAFFVNFVLACYYVARWCWRHRSQAAEFALRNHPRRYQYRPSHRREGAWYI